MCGEIEFGKCDICGKFIITEAVIIEDVTLKPR